MTYVVAKYTIYADGTWDESVYPQTDKEILSDAYEIAKGMADDCARGYGHYFISIIVGPVASVITLTDGVIISFTVKENKLVDIPQPQNNGTSYITGLGLPKATLDRLYSVKPGSKWMSITDGSVWRAYPYAGSEGTFQYRSHFVSMVPERLLETYGNDLYLLWEQA